MTRRLGVAACLCASGALVLAATPRPQGNGPRAVNGTAAAAAEPRPNTPAADSGSIPDSAPIPEIKAAFVLNFVRFTTWPERAFPDSAAPIVIGLVGRGEFADAVTRVVRGRVVQGRPLLLRRIGEGAMVGAPPHLIVFDGGAAARLASILIAVGDAPVGTVGDVPGFCARGGLFNLFLEQDHVRFEVNPAAADRRGLQLSSSLLRLARRGPSEPGAKGR
ncbi:MAG TPA: YfiR family protein [Candidatus Polarisedimenticolia bacterium]|nr:YfiR family protein [Candidatus Polarisedimenticolia bacterium]